MGWSTFIQIEGVINVKYPEPPLREIMAFLINFCQIEVPSDF